MFYQSSVYQLPEGLADDVKEGDRAIVLCVTGVLAWFGYDHHDTLFPLLGVISSAKAVIKDLCDGNYQGLQEVVDVDPSYCVFSRSFVFKSSENVVDLSWMEWFEEVMSWRESGDVY